jgi:hypothetical protein
MATLLIVLAYLSIPFIPESFDPSFLFFDYLNIITVLFLCLNNWDYNKNSNILIFVCVLQVLIEQILDHFGFTTWFLWDIIIIPIMLYILLTNIIGVSGVSYQTTGTYYLYRKPTNPMQVIAALFNVGFGSMSIIYKGEHHKFSKGKVISTQYKKKKGDVLVSCDLGYTAVTATKGLRWGYFKNCFKVFRNVK